MTFEKGTAGVAFMTRLLTPLFTFLFLAGWAQAEARLEPDCAVTANNDGVEILKCDFRLSEPAGLSRAELLVDRTPLEGSEFEPFDDYGTTAWLFLLDRTDPARKKTVARTVELVKHMMSKAQANRLMGVATFADKLEMIVTPGDAYADLDSRMSTIKADGVATEFFATSLDAINILKGIEADRRGLIIISDGKAEDTAYTRDEVVEAAREAGVTIFSLGFAEKGTETPALQTIRRLAEDTGGAFVSTIGDDPLPKSFVSGFNNYLENGGTVEAPIGDISGDFESTLHVRLDDGQELSSIAQLTASEKIEPEPQRPETLLTTIYSALSPVWPGASDWAYENAGLAWALLALPILLIFLVIYLVMRRRRRGTDEGGFTGDNDTVDDDPFETHTLASDTPYDGENATRVVGNESSPVLGYFVMLDDVDNRFAIREKSVTIGRHSENEFRLNNDSVHRHHAHFHMTDDMRGTITDLDTANGVRVNGEQVNRRELHNGDLIELGEVRFRYMEPGSLH